MVIPAALAIRNMNGMVGGTTRCQKADDGVHDGLFIDATAERAVIIPIPADTRQPVDGRAREFLAQLRSRVHKRRSGHMQPHDFNHHLVGIGGVIEGAGARAVVALAFGLQQRFPPDLALGGELANALLFRVGKA